MKPPRVTTRDPFVGQRLSRRSFSDLEAHFARIGRSAGYGEVSNSYSRVGVVFACVRAKAEAFGAMPLMVSTVDDQVIESGPLVELAEQPNPTMTGRSLRRATSAHLDLFGRVHWFLLRDSVGRVLEVHPLNPLQMKPVTDKQTGELHGWEFTAAGRYAGEKKLLSLDEVHTITDPDYEDCANPYAGLSPRRAVSHAISQFYKADVANEASLDNGVEPGGAFTMDGTATEGQIASMREQLSARHRGPGNRRNFMILHGGMKWQQIAASFSEMEFSELKKLSRTDICAAFGVPPAVVGYYEDSNFAHAEAAERGFWIRTILPRAAWLAEEWDHAILDSYQTDRSLTLRQAMVAPATAEQRTSPGYRRAVKAARRSRRRFYSWFDSSDVPAVQQARLAQVETVARWNSIGVPLNQLIRATDAPFEQVAWGDTWFKPLGLVDVTDESLPWGDDPPMSEDDDAAAQGDEKAGVRALALATDTKADEARGRLWASWRASWAGLEKAVRSKVKRHFNELRSSVLQRVAAELPDVQSRGLAIERRDLIGRILFDLVEANQRLIALAGPLLRDATRLGGSQAMQEAADAEGKANPSNFMIDDPEVGRAMRRREIRLVGANRTVQHHLAKTIADALDAGEGLDEIKERVKHTFNVAGSRASTIARTETGGAVEEARAIGREQAGTPMKSWLWSRKETGRPSHAATERETMASPIPNSLDFTIVGTSVTCPHPRASGVAGHDINCGCTCIARYPGDDVKAVLNRYLARGFVSYEQMIQRDQQPTNRGDDS